MEILLNSDTWYVFSFVIFALILIKVGLPALNAMLDDRIEQIKKDLEESENLRVEAQEMLAQYQRKHRDAVQEAEAILKTAKDNAKNYKKQAEAELKELMDRREQQLEERLSRMQQNAMNEIQAHAAELSIQTAREIIVQNLDKKTNTALVDKAIEDIKGNIH